MFRFRAAIALSGIVIWNLGALPSFAQLGQSEWQTPGGAAPTSQLGQSEWQTPAGSSSQFGTSAGSTFGQEGQAPAFSSGSGSQLGQSEWQTPASSGSSQLGQSQWQTPAASSSPSQLGQSGWQLPNGAAAKITPQQSMPQQTMPQQTMQSMPQQFTNSGSSSLGQSDWQQPNGAQSSGSQTGQSAWQQPSAPAASSAVQASTTNATANTTKAKAPLLGGVLDQEELNQANPNIPVGAAPASNKRARRNSITAASRPLRPGIANSDNSNCSACATPAVRDVVNGSTR